MKLSRNPAANIDLNLLHTQWLEDEGYLEDDKFTMSIQISTLLTNTDESEFSFNQRYLEV